MREQLTLFAEGTLAKDLAQPGKDAARKTKGISGRKCGESFSKHAPVGSFVKTLEAILASVSTPLPHNWKMTASPSGRLLFQLAPSVPRTEEIGSGLWPTIRATDGERGGRGDLIQAVRGNPNKHYQLWQTPNVPNGGRVNPADMSPTGLLPNGKKRQVGLEHQVRMVEASLWPTPTVNGNNNRAGISEKSGDGLATAVKQWPTPAARDYRSPNAKPYAERGGGKRGEQLPNTVGGQLNPEFVEALMGYPPGYTQI
jgi:hypothetical protein